LFCYSFSLLFFYDLFCFLSYYRSNSYLNLKQIPHFNIKIKEHYHPILKSRIIAQKLFLKNKKEVKILEKYHEKQNISKLPIEYFYEIIINAMITKNSEVMEWIINKA
jgi:hypothetical protein